MIQYVSTKGGTEPVDFETAILDGFAADGGLYVPTELPKITETQLSVWKDLSFIELAYEILAHFIDESVMTEKELRQILDDSYSTFYESSIVPFHQLSSQENLIVQELFHGPTLSFKDIGMAFIVNLFNFFLQRKGEKMTIVVATTGDTGPAAAHASSGKATIDTWVLYPKEMITEEQERQMTTLSATNIYPVGVSNCPDGADDLDILIAELFADKDLKETLNLSSVNSINWGRVMMQTVHYFYGYLKIIDRVGESLNFAVPSGAFGNLCAGSLARAMGLPVGKFIVSNNQNACLHRIFSKGIFSKQEMINCPSSAIDILVPYNFWRYLYFAIGQDSEKIKSWMETYHQNGIVEFDRESYEQYREGFISYSISDEQTLSTIREVYEQEDYVLDPHAAVAVAAANIFSKTNSIDAPILCLATAHPSKFPVAIADALGTKGSLPKSAKHFSIEAAKKYCEKTYTCDFENMRTAIPKVMRDNAKYKMMNEK